MIAGSFLIAFGVVYLFLCLAMWLFEEDKHYIDMKGAERVAKYGLLCGKVK